MFKMAINPMLAEKYEQVRQRYFKSRLQIVYNKGDKVIYDSKTGGYNNIPLKSEGVVEKDNGNSVDAWFLDKKGEMKLWGSIYKIDVTNETQIS